MSLLSRFRKTVMPSSSRNKKTIEDDAPHHNYRRPTKSFNEKSVKLRNPTQSNTNHANDDYYYHDSRDKNHRSASKLSTRSSAVNTNKLTKNNQIKNNSGRGNKNLSDKDNGNLSRSDTFTLEEEQQLQNGTYTRSMKKDKLSNIDSHYGDEMDSNRKRGTFSF